MRDARVVTLKNRRKWCEMRRGATCCVGGARCVWVRDAHYNVISVLGVRDAKGCEMRIFLGGCESLCPPFTGMYCHRRFDIGDLEHPALKRKSFYTTVSESQIIFSSILTCSNFLELL